MKEKNSKKTQDKKVKNDNNFFKKIISKLKKMSKKKKVFFGIVLVILICIGINAIKPKEEVQEELNLELIERRDIATSISAKGTIETDESKNVTSVLTGSRIVTVNVKEGDKINVGDVICTFDVSTIKTSVGALQKQMTATQAQSNISVSTAQRNLDNAKANRESSISQGDVDNALNSLNNVNNQLAAAKSAKAAFDATYNQAATVFATVEADYKSAETAKAKAENDYNAALVLVPEADQPSDTNLIALQADFNDKQSQYLLAQNRYNDAVATFEPIKAKYTQLQAAVTGLESQAAGLQTAYDTVKKNYDNAMKTADSTIANLNDQLSQAQISAGAASAAYQAQMAAYNNQLKDGTLKSTVSGTVTKVNVKKGDIYTGAVICVIEGCDEFVVETNIDEYDIPDIDVGMRAFIKTDATRDEEMEGQVTYTAASANNDNAMAMAAATSTGNAKYLVKIALNDQNDRLRLGMNAKISIVTSSKENVWTVPFDSVEEREDGTKYIRVVENDDLDNIKEINVTTGIEGTYYVEIVEASEEIKDGMKVVIPEVEADNAIENLIKAMGAEAGV